MEPLELIADYLPQGRMMQVATVADAQPWVCTVYYVEDEHLDLYWLSLPTRRHSLEIARHNRIAVAIPIKVDKPVIGIQAQGSATAVANKRTIAKVMKRYVERHEVGEQFYDNFVAGRNQHVLFRFKPTTYVLFDEVTFQADGRREVNVAERG